MTKIKTMLVVVSLVLSAPLWAKKESADASIYSPIKLRNIGPGVTSGRITDFAVNPKKPSQYYAATASGGLWKTDNAGVTWKTVFDTQNSYSLGDVTMDPNNSNVIWVGSGENNSQRSVAYGDGVYKSIDGGESWKNVGLENSEHIGKILIDPRDSNTVYVAAQGPLWNAGGDRGLYKTTDGGETWNAVLTISKDTGVSDIAFDPRNPDVIYATAYQRRRHVWTLINGGPESNIYKTTDAGKTWNKINKGLPSGDLGRIGIAVAPSAPDTVYAIVEAAEGKGGFFKSTNAGASWKKQSNYLAGSPQYYQEIVIDPHNSERVYSLDTYLMVTENGGKSFKRAGEKDKHVDNHAMWINPNDTDHLLVGCDGGIYESWDRAKNWTFRDNMSLTQFYRVTVDNDFPFYNVFGGTQDNASLGAPHRTTNSSGIRNSDWIYTQFGDGFKSAIDPTDPNIIYSQYQYGGLARYDKKSGERIQIQPISPDPKVAQKFNWNSPLLISPHNHKRLYYASQQVFRSDDQGESWRAVSGDLSQKIDRNKLKVMDRVWSVDAVAKNKSTSQYGSIISLQESRLKEGLLYVGTDDGALHISENGGKVWRQMRWPSDVPKMTYVSDLEPSLYNDKVAFATFDNHKKGDFKPYVMKTDDNGKSWDDITGDLPERGSVHTIAQDHVNKNLLFVGTEFGVFFTQNGGKNWVQLKSGIPTIAVRDIEIQRRENDLALATFGRGFYILDDYSPLRSDAQAVKKADATLFPVRRAFQFVIHDPLGLPGKSMRGADFYFADNPEYGAVFSYYLKDGFTSLNKKRRSAEKKKQKDGKDVFYPAWDSLKKEDQEQKPYLVFTVTDADGNLVKRIKSPVKSGFNRVNWDLKYPGFDTADTKKPSSGPFAVPGMYKVSMAKVENGVTTQLTEPQSFEVKSIDNRTFPSSDRKADLAFDLKVGQLSKSISGARTFMRNMDKRINHVKTAIFETPTIDQSLMQQVHSMTLQLADLNLAFSGDAVKRKRQEAVPHAITNYISYLIWSRSENTGHVTPDQKERFKRASESFNQLHSLLEKLNNDLAKLEELVGKNSNNWLPGQLPSKGVH